MVKMFKRIFSIFICLIILSSIGGTYYLSIYASSELQEWKDLKNRKQIYFRVDSAFSSIERIKIEEALKRWEDKTGRNVKLRALIGDVTVSEIFSWQSDGLPTIYKASSWWSWKNHVGRHISGSWTAMGVATTFSGDIFIMCGEPIFKDVVTHEVGHIIINAKWHSTDEESIMYHNIRATGDGIIKQEEINLVKQVK
jgi:hypothetical protein